MVVGPGWVGEGTMRPGWAGGVSDLGEGIDEEGDGIEDHEVAEPLLVEVHDKPEAVEEEKARAHFLLERHAPAPEP